MIQVGSDSWLFASHHTGGADEVVFLQGVTLTGVRQELVELRSLGGRAARLVDEDLGAASRFERLDLECCVLVLSADARVPEKIVCHEASVPEGCDQALSSARGF